MGMKFSREDRMWREVDQEGWWRFRNPGRYIFFLFLVILIVVGLWFLLAPSPQPVNSEDLPVIQAATGSYKTKVDDSYVSSVPHQDKLIYERISGTAVAEQQVEHILPTPEAPKAPMYLEPEAGPILVSDEEILAEEGPLQESPTDEDQIILEGFSEKPALKMTQPYNPEIEKVSQVKEEPVKAKSSGILSITDLIQQESDE